MSSRGGINAAKVFGEAPVAARNVVLSRQERLGLVRRDGETAFSQISGGFQPSVDVASGEFLMRLM